MENKSLESLFESSKINPYAITVETTITSGFEKVAEDECLEVFGKDTPISADRGKIYFNIPIINIQKVFSMRSIDNVCLVVHFCTLNLISEKNEDLMAMREKYSEIDWKKALAVWRDIYKFSGLLYPSREEYESFLNLFVVNNNNNPKKCRLEKIRRETNIEVNSAICELNEEECCETKMTRDVSEMKRASLPNDVSNEGTIREINPEMAVPTFRVSAKRVGTHCFTSEDVARIMGAVIQENLLWIVDLNNFDIEVMIDTIDSEFIVKISLTKSSLHRRNLTAFGLTSLRATICYSLLRLARPKVGDIVMDPLAGSGSIPLEGALAFPGSYFLAGDSQDVPCKLCSSNFKNAFSSESKSFYPSLLQWNALSLPIRSSTVDIIVTDMPFGKRSGSKKSNKVLYPGVLKEFGRVLRKGSGKAVLLTADRRSLELAHSVTKNLWKLADRRLVNVGGLRAVVFLLRRTMVD